MHLALYGASLAGTAPLVGLLRRLPAQVADRGCGERDAPPGSDPVGSRCPGSCRCRSRRRADWRPTGKEQAASPGARHRRAAAIATRTRALTCERLLRHHNRLTAGTMNPVDDPISVRVRNADNDLWRGSAHRRGGLAPRDALRLWGRRGAGPDPPHGHVIGAGRVGRRRRTGARRGGVPRLAGRVGIARRGGSLPRHAPDFTIELRQQAILLHRASLGDPCIGFVAVLWEDPAREYRPTRSSRPR